MGYFVVKRRLELLVLLSMAVMMLAVLIMITTWEGNHNRMPPLRRLRGQVCCSR